MNTSVRKWGNSLGVRLPKTITEQVNICEGSAIDIIVRDNKIEITKLDSNPNLDMLLASISETNLHNEIDFGASVGNEL